MPAEQIDEIIACAERTHYRLNMTVCVYIYIYNYIYMDRQSTCAQHSTSAHIRLMYEEWMQSMS